MAAGLALTTLTPSGPGHYTTSRCIFDVLRVTNQTLLLQVVQALDLGFQHRNGTALMAEMCGILETGKSHGVTFFDVSAEAVAGTNARPGDSADGGVSFWRYGGAWNKRDAPVRERDSLRIWLNPTGGNFSVTGEGFEYNRLVNILWHELHHCTTTQHHRRATAPYDVDDQWRGAIADIARAFPKTARDPVTGRQVSMFGPDQWTRNDKPRALAG